MDSHQISHQDHLAPNENEEEHQALLLVNKTPKNGRLKTFLNKHSNVVDFLCANLIICLCFIVLLPRVHESFSPSSDQDDPNSPASEQNTTSAIEDNHDSNHYHHHHHNFPTGEILICLGFFIFYCIGLRLKHPASADQVLEQVTLSRRRSVTSTICCPSTRCPSSTMAPSVSGLSTQNYTTLVADQEKQGMDVELTNGNDCLLLLNRHHQHHTHSRHHDHHSARDQAMIAGQKMTFLEADENITVEKATTNKRLNYGSASNNNPDGTTNIIVDEIRITTHPGQSNYKNHCWPKSLKMLLVSLFLSAAIVLLDMNAFGLLRTLKVFRATSTGALLYIAFFMVLPKQSAGCKSCRDEES